MAIFPDELRCTSLNLVWEWFLLEVALANPSPYPHPDPDPNPSPSPNPNPNPNLNPNPNPNQVAGAMPPTALWATIQEPIAPQP